jgi:hypothetical protein
VEKIYIIANNTSGGQAIRVIGATGTGVIIPNGATQVIYCDGTNFIAASGAFTNGSVLSVAGGGTGQSSLTANNVILGNGTSGVQFVAPGASGNFLVSNGTTWISQAGDGFATGTRMTFNQTNAPTGWTKDTGTDNAAFRLVSGSVSSGGTVDFTTAFVSQTPNISISSISGSAGATTLSTPQIPSHTHDSIFGGGCGPGSYKFSSQFSGDAPPDNNPVRPTAATGGGGSHTHPFSFSSGSATSSAINLAVKYVDLIIAQKN